MSQPLRVINDAFKVQDRLKDAEEDAVFDYWTGTSIFSANQLLIKVLKENPGLGSYFKSYLEWIQAIYTVNSSALLDVLEINQTDDGRIVVVSENHNYQFLETVIRKNSGFLLEHVCRFVIEIGQAINAFHRNKLIYGGLDAKSILVHTSGGFIDELKIQKAGYGPFLQCFSKTIQPDFATQVYLAPELHAEKMYTLQSDIYSLGVHLFVFFTGLYPVASAAQLSSGPSLRFVAKALARRHIPPELILLVLRCLRHDPMIRPVSVIDVLTPLRLFIDERRKRVLRSEGLDPMAVLDSLNMGNQRFNAQEVIRVLDTLDYFKNLAEPSVETSGQSVLRYPLNDFVNLQKVKETEAEEALDPADDGALSPEDYLEKAVSEVQREEFSSLSSNYQGLIDDYNRITGAKKPTVVQGKSPELPVAADVIEAQFIPVEIGEDPALKKTPALEARELQEKRVLWKASSVTVEDIVSRLKRSVVSAKKGSGTVCFLQEPPRGPHLLLINKALYECKLIGLYTDLGALPRQASASYVMHALLRGMVPALRGESKRVLQRLSRKLINLGFGQLLQIEYAVPGYHSIFIKDLTSTNLQASECVDIISVFCRKSKPLFVVMRNVDNLDPEAHNLILALAQKRSLLPIVVVGFYTSRVVPDWHILKNAFLS